MYSIMYSFSDTEYMQYARVCRQCSRSLASEEDQCLKCGAVALESVQGFNERIAALRSDIEAVLSMEVSFEFIDFFLFFKIKEYFLIHNLFRRPKQCTSHQSTIKSKSSN